MDYRFHDGAVFFPDQELLCMADLHLGYEAELRAKGAYVPTSEFQALFKRITRLLGKTWPRVVVINGDFKHAFGRISDAEWRHARQLLELLTSNDRHVVLVAGNHDPLLGPLAELEGLEIVPDYQADNVLFTHGDTTPSISDDTELVVIGHVHPAVSLTDGSRVEKAKCYLVGPWRGRELLVLPSMFSLTEGVDVLREPLNTPLLEDVDPFQVYVLIEAEAKLFGTVKELARMAKRQRL